MEVIGINEDATIGDSMLNRINPMTTVRRTIHDGLLDLDTKFLWFRKSILLPRLPLDSNSNVFFICKEAGSLIACNLSYAARSKVSILMCVPWVLSRLNVMDDYGSGIHIFLRTQKLLHSMLCVIKETLSRVLVRTVVNQNGRVNQSHSSASP